MTFYLSLSACSAWPSKVDGFLRGKRFVGACGASDARMRARTRAQVLRTVDLMLFICCLFPFSGVLLFRWQGTRIFGKIRAEASWASGSFRSLELAKDTLIRLKSYGCVSGGDSSTHVFYPVCVLRKSSL